MSKDLTFETETRESGALLYRLSGWLYGTKSGYAFQEEVRQKVASGSKRFVIDLTDVQRIDSCGIGILAASIFSAQKAGAGMVLAAMPANIQRMLGLTMFLDHVAHADSVDEAMASVLGMELPPGAN